MAPLRRQYGHLVKVAARQEHGAIQRLKWPDQQKRKGDEMKGALRREGLCLVPFLMLSLFVCRGCC